jgi:hypothetical protein
MKFFPNGVIVQTKELTNRSWFEEAPRTADHLAYQGVEKYESWPLELDDDPALRELSQDVEQYFYEGPSCGENYFAHRILPSRTLSIQYIDQCAQRKMGTRVIFCMTERTVPIWDGSIPNLIFLGYDHVDLAGNPTSSIYWNLLFPPSDEYKDVPVYKSFLECKILLNDNMLFGTEAGISTYIERMEKVLQSEIQRKDEYIEGHGIIPQYLIEPIEEHDDYHIVKVFEVNGDL